MDNRNLNIWNIPLPKKLFFALMGLLLLISVPTLNLTIVAQTAPNVPLLPQNQGLLTENGFGEPDITVDSTADTVDANPGDGICADAGGQCTLRAAIMESNAFPLTQTIYVPAGTYLLTISGTDEDAAATGDLDITDTVLIIGAGQGETIIDGNDIDRVFHIKLGTVSSDYNEIDPMLAQMTIQRGKAPYGGGIFNDGQAAIGQFLTLRDNYADGQYLCGTGAGAAAYSTDSLELYESLVTENRTPSISTETTYGALASHANRLTLNITTVTNNQTDWALVLSHTGCDNAPYISNMYLSLIANNAGGAILIDQSDFFMFSSTITNNAAGILGVNPSAPPEGLGWIRIGGSTIADNGPYGIKSNGYYGFEIADVIISGQTQSCDMSAAFALDPDYDYEIYSEYTLFDDDSCPISGGPVATNLYDTDPLLLPLNDNGGWTETRAVAEGSPAIGSGGCSWNGVTFSYDERILDQRGFLPAGITSCTMGAYEYNDMGGDFTSYLYGSDSSNITLSQSTNQLTRRIYIKSGDLFNPLGNIDPHDVTNPSNYLLVMPGSDDIFQTESCAQGVQGDDITVPISRILYGTPWFINYANYDWREGGDPGLGVIEFDSLAVGGTEYYLPEGDYQFHACDSIHDVRGKSLDSEFDGYAGGEYFAAFTSEHLSLPTVTQINSTFQTLLPDGQIRDIPSNTDSFEFVMSVPMDGYGLINSNNMALVQGGPNGIVETQTCDAVTGDDISIPLGSGPVGHYTKTSSGPDPFTVESPFTHAFYSVNQVLTANSYRIMMCDSTLSLERIPLDGDFDGVPGGNFMLDFITDGFVPPLPTPSAPTLNDYSDVLVALNLPTVGEVPAGTVIQIERTTGGSASIVGSVDVGTASFVDSNLICETAYRYRVRLYDANENQFSVWSDYLDVTTANCVTSLQHTFGLYKEGQWLFYAVDGYQREDVRFQYGPAETGWTALVGDWNGDGLPGIGLYKDGTFLLRELAGAGVADANFDFGPPTGAAPLVGDWDGNGTDTVGVFNSGTFSLRNSNDAGAADLIFNLGSASSLPLAGDWDGDSTDSVGYFENNTFHLATSGASPTINSTFSFGPVGWSPIVGDWAGDLTDTVGLYNDGLWRLRNSNMAGPVDYGFSYGDLDGGWQPLAFDGDTSVLNRLFNATVPTPRVPVIPGPELPLPTEEQLDSQPSAIDSMPIEPTLVPSLMSTATPEAATPTAASSAIESIAPSATFTVSPTPVDG